MSPLGIGVVIVWTGSVVTLAALAFSEWLYLRRKRRERDRDILAVSQEFCAHYWPETYEESARALLSDVRGLS